jgi:hypothetical protein
MWLLVKVFEYQKFMTGNRSKSAKCQNKVICESSNNIIYFGPLIRYNILAL